MVLIEYHDRAIESQQEPDMLSTETYQAAVADLRGLLRKIGRHEFRAYGYVPQLRQYRAAVRAAA